jgi:hypothetical protein
MTILTLVGLHIDTATNGSSSMKDAYLSVAQSTSDDRYTVKPPPTPSLATIGLHPGAGPTALSQHCVRNHSSVPDFLHAGFFSVGTWILKFVGGTITA